MFLDPADFPLTRALESGWETVLREYEQLSPQQWVEWPERQIYNQGWDVFGLWGMGHRFDANCRACPETAALLDSIPGITTAGFSRMAPATRILPHEGYTNTVLRCHLGLIVPEQCGIEVGGETRHWQAGKCLVFDDTVTHQAWNESSHTRVILLLDFVRNGETFKPALTPEAAALLASMQAERE